MVKTYKPVEEVTLFIEKNKGSEFCKEIEAAEVHEWFGLGAPACPKEKTMEQRNKYFSTIKFSTIREVLDGPDVE